MAKTSEKHVNRFRRGIKIFDIIIISLIVAASIYLTLNYNNITTYAISDMRYYGLWALFVFTFLFEFLPQLISPDYLLLLAFGLGINVYSAVLITIIASMLGSWLAFLIGYHYGFGVVAPLFEENQLKKILKFWKKHGKWFVFFSGTVPLPIPYIPVVFGALRMRKRDFILWGIIPRAIGFIVTGVVAYYWLGWIIRFF
jgi:membrane-associated protein